jgi:hypothetical protein
MRKWWIAIAAVLGIGLAVLLIPKPDTGADVPDSTGSTTKPTAADGTAGPEGLVVGRHTPGSVKTGDGKLGLNPIAAQVAERRAGPELTYASRALAPWTQIRRLIAGKNSTDPAVLGLVEEADQMTKDMRALRRDPMSMDFGEFEAKQRDLVQRIRQSPAHDEEIEKYLALVEQRLGDYATEKAAAATSGGEGDAPEEGGAAEPGDPTEPAEPDGL